MLGIAQLHRHLATPSWASACTQRSCCRSKAPSIHAGRSSGRSSLHEYGRSEVYVLHVPELWLTEPRINKSAGVPVEAEAGGQVTQMVARVVD